MRISLYAVFVVFAFAAPAMAAPEVGKPAPDFTAQDIAGKEQKLSAYKGKIVVLEWHNPGYPFVKKHYESGNMQQLQKEAAAQQVVWLTINSGAPGKQGHMSAEEAKKVIADANASPAAYILDSEGRVGKLYDAKTTPHMFVIDSRGMLAYAGAIDDKPSTKQEDIKTSRNHVREALQALREGKPAPVASTTAYGCAVKYGS